MHLGWSSAGWALSSRLRPAAGGAGVCEEEQHGRVQLAQLIPGVCSVRACVFGGMWSRVGQSQRGCGLVLTTEPDVALFDHRTLHPD